MEEISKYLDEKNKIKCFEDFILCYLLEEIENRKRNYIYNFVYFYDFTPYTNKKMTSKIRLRINLLHIICLVKFSSLFFFFFKICRIKDCGYQEFTVCFSS